MSAFARHDLGKFVIRVSLGVLILMHGISKLSNGVGFIENTLQQHGLPGFLAYGVYVGEVIAPLMVIVGYYCRIGAAVIAINMVVAIALVHSGQLFQMNQQGGWALELQGMFLFTAVGVALMGAGGIAMRSRWN